jgi:hypothetical protein
VIGVLAALVFCVLIPFLVMAMLAPSLDKTAPKVGNFRGVMVYNGLGIVWFVWLISFWVGGHFLAILHIAQPAWISYLVPLFPLVAGSCAFGLFDDWAGCNVIKGFRGHLRALAHGRLTTGGLKFLGIGFLSLFLALSLYYEGAPSLLRVVLVTAVVALAANLMNLFDLRPGRAGKIYSIGLVLALLCIAFSGVLRFSGWDLAALALAGLGPLVAVWRFDLGERGMLGDAGANSMGAFLGFLFATALPLWALAVAAVGLIAVNALSERVSFSKIIEGNPILSAWDDWGRTKVADKDNETGDGGTGAAGDKDRAPDEDRAPDKAPDKAPDRGRDKNRDKDTKEVSD